MFLQNDKEENIIKSSTPNIPASIASGNTNNINSLQQNLEITLSTIKNYTKININYEKDSSENNNISNRNNVYDSRYEFFTLLNQLGETNICPFYYFNNLINLGNADLIICTYKDFFDPKNRIKLKNLIPESQRNNYKLIFDECGDIDYLIQDYFSMNIDENILHFSSDDLFILRERYKIFKESSKEVEMTKNENGEGEINKKLIVENEALEFNGFSRKFLGNLNYLNTINKKFLIFISIT